MQKWLVFNSQSGHEFGVYEGLDDEAAIKGMLLDAGDVDADDPIEDICAICLTLYVYKQLVKFFAHEPVEIAGEDYYETAREWAETGFTFDIITEYIEAGCFCADSAKILAEAGIAPAHLTIVDEDNRTLGHRFANSDISLDALKRAIGDGMTDLADDIIAM
jgi:hypothetical protein